MFEKLERRGTMSTYSAPFHSIPSSICLFSLKLLWSHNLVLTTIVVFPFKFAGLDENYSWLTTWSLATTSTWGREPDIQKSSKMKPRFCLHCQRRRSGSPTKLGRCSYYYNLNCSWGTTGGGICIYIVIYNPQIPVSARANQITSHRGFFFFVSVSHVAIDSSISPSRNLKHTLTWGEIRVTKIASSWCSAGTRRDSESSQREYAQITR